MKKISMFVVTDGREGCLAKTLQSFTDNVRYPFLEKIIVNDCMDESFSKKLNSMAEHFGFDKVINHKIKKGFAGVYNTAWKNISEEADYVFNLEDDFLFNQEIDLNLLAAILDANDHLVQIALKRQPWNEQEKKAGGIIEQWPNLYEQKEIGFLKWVEHNLFYTTNPSLTPGWVIEQGWPLVPQSESVFSRQLFQNPNLRSAYLGEKFQAPMVHHIGEERVGNGY